jgi:N-acetylglucosamine-6-phosphate deacetylase
MSVRALIGADVFDGGTLHRGKAVVLAESVFDGVFDPADLPAGARIVKLDGGTLAPGFVDLQVNGGGGVLFNDAPCVETLNTIAAAHASTGTRAILPTLITDTPAQTRAAIAAVENAISVGVAGIIGLHLEGPHLSIDKKGAHDAALVRPMTDADETLLSEAAQRVPNLMVTLAPESVSMEQIFRLSKAVVIVSVGHSDCTADQAKAAFEAGAVCATHLFNAMRQLGSREPGLVGAALSTPGITAGLIADGIHVHPDTIRVAMAAASAGGLFLVTDAMATVGSDITEFRLNGRRVLRRDGRLTLEEGTLAGADLTMPQAIRVMVEDVGISLEAALRMATGTPVGVLRDAMGFGALVPGMPWSGIHLSPDYSVSDPSCL